MLYSRLPNNIRGVSFFILNLILYSILFSPSYMIEPWGHLQMNILRRHPPPLVAFNVFRICVAIFYPSPTFIKTTPFIQKSRALWYRLIFQLEVESTVVPIDISFRSREHCGTD